MILAQHALPLQQKRWQQSVTATVISTMTATPPAIISLPLKSSLPSPWGPLQVGWRVRVEAEASQRSVSHVDAGKLGSVGALS